eukprot:365335-Chlamydomonas_euryale.AAC.4
MAAATAAAADTESTKAGGGDDVGLDACARIRTEEARSVARRADACSFPHRRHTAVDRPEGEGKITQCSESAVPMSVNIIVASLNFTQPLSQAPQARAMRGNLRMQHTQICPVEAKQKALWDHLDTGRSQLYKGPKSTLSTPRLRLYCRPDCKREWGWRPASGPPMPPPAEWMREAIPLIPHHKNHKQYTKEGKKLERMNRTGKGRLMVADPRLEL